jgi:hypothetical protein
MIGNRSVKFPVVKESTRLEVVFEIWLHLKVDVREIAQNNVISEKNLFISRKG